MTKEEAIKLLENVELELEKVWDIYQNFKKNSEVVSAVAMNLSRRTSVYEREAGAHPLMTLLLKELAQAEDMSARWAVAKNPHTPREVLEKLAQDPINLVRALTATNPNTPKDILKSLFNDEKIVRDGLSGNPSTPAKLLNILADDSDKMVRLRVAENPSTQRETLEKLSRDADVDVSKAAQIRLEKI